MNRPATLSPPRPPVPAPGNCSVRAPSRTWNYERRPPAHTSSRTALVSLIALSLLSAPAAAIDLQVELLDGTTITGQLTAVVPQLKLVGKNGPVELRWPDVLSVTPRIRPGRSPDATTQADDHPLRFSLSDGSSFYGTVAARAGKGVEVQLHDMQRVRLEFPMIASIVKRDVSDAARARLDEIAAEKGRTADHAVVARGDKIITLRGALRQMDASHVVFTWNKRDVRLPWQRIAGLILADGPPRGGACEILLHSGERFVGRVSGGSSESITLQSGIFDALILPWPHIARIDCRSDRLVFLSSLEPSRYDFEPFLDKHWNYGVDSSLSGKPIVIRGRSYARGLTMHSKSALTYRIDGRFRQFAATVAIVDEMADRGVVTMSVVGDGRVLWKAEDVRGGGEPQRVLVNVTNVAELELLVDFGGDLDLSDHACWAFARLIR